MVRPNSTIQVHGLNEPLQVLSSSSRSPSPHNQREKTCACYSRLSFDREALLEIGCIAEAWTQTRMPPSHAPVKDPGRGTHRAASAVPFMAIEILLSLRAQRTIEHQVHHDLESFAWVFGCFMARHLLENSRSCSIGDREEIEEHFRSSSFGDAGLEDIIVSRTAFLPLNLARRRLPAGLVPQPMSAFMAALLSRVKANQAEDDDRPVHPFTIKPTVTRLTHEVLLAMIEYTIHQLEGM